VVLDLHRRLGAAGHPLPSGAEAGSFSEATEAALREFQRDRGLAVDGRCDAATWTALVEASWHLGDRPLVLTSPNMRGDDVADLQVRLGRLGFDCGRVDGIFGPATSRALIDFQSNCGLPTDGICGRSTVRSILRVSSQTGTGPGVALVREREEFDHGVRTIATARIAVGQAGPIGSLPRDLGRRLRRHGAAVMILDELDPSAQAVAANRFGAHLFIGLEGTPEPCSTVHFYGVPSFESVAGRALAESLVVHLGPVMNPADRRQRCANWPTSGPRRMPALRETRMPAVHCVLGPVAQVADQATAISIAMFAAVEQWMSGRA